MYDMEMVWSKMAIEHDIEAATEAEAKRFTDKIVFSSSA